jgi:hypothetical protein
MAADAHRVVVHREPEWDEESRQGALAAMYVERTVCQMCGARDALREVPALDRHGSTVTEFPVVWPDGTRVVLKRYRCLGCVSRDLADEDFREAHTDDKADRKRLTAGVRHVVEEVIGPT